MNERRYTIKTNNTHARKESIPTKPYRLQDSNLLVLFGKNRVPLTFGLVQERTCRFVPCCVPCCHRYRGDAMNKNGCSIGRIKLNSGYAYVVSDRDVRPAGLHLHTSGVEVFVRDGRRTLEARDSDVWNTGEEGR